MDDLVEKILDQLKDEAVDIGSDLIKDGVDLLKQHLEGRAGDEEIMAWLRQVQGGAS